MSFSDKDRPDNRVNTVPSEVHTEDITGRHKETPRGMMSVSVVTDELSRRKRT